MQCHILKQIVIIKEGYIISKQRLFFGGAWRVPNADIMSTYGVFCFLEYGLMVINQYAYRKQNPEELFN